MPELFGLRVHSGCKPTVQLRAPFQSHAGIAARDGRIRRADPNAVTDACELVIAVGLFDPNAGAAKRGERVFAAARFLAGIVDEPNVVAASRAVDQGVRYRARAEGFGRDQNLVAVAGTNHGGFAGNDLRFAAKRERLVDIGRDDCIAAAAAPPVAIVVEDAIVDDRDLRVHGSRTDSRIRDHADTMPLQCIRYGSVPFRSIVFVCGLLAKIDADVGAAIGRAFESAKNIASSEYVGVELNGLGTVDSSDDVG